jgi:hypothetical protein
MKIRIIFWIAVVSTFLQALPLYVGMFSREFKLILIGDVFGESPSTGQ